VASFPVFVCQRDDFIRFVVALQTEGIQVVDRSDGSFVDTSTLATVLRGGRETMGTYLLRDGNAEAGIGWEIDESNNETLSVVFLCPGSFARGKRNRQFLKKVKGILRATVPSIRMFGDPPEAG